MNLSICIPTYNRPCFLRWTLKKLCADFPDSEIIVSDNDSDISKRDARDDTCIRWVQQLQNIGPFPNQLAALREATRKYAVYCADDDYLLPERVTEAIEYLEGNSGVAAYIAPCEIYDEVNQKAFWPAFTCEPVTFDRARGMELWNFLIEHHVWPEHVIYRTPVPLAPRTRAYWCFADLVELLEAGMVHFSPVPFYRNLLVHPLGEREQLGNVQCLTYFDEYRAGLEVLAYGLFGEQPYKTRRQIQDMIAAFICQRMHNASVLYDRAGQEREAQMLRQRIAIASPVRDAG